MTTNIAHYATLAKLFRYPSGELKTTALESYTLLENYDDGMKAHFRPFLNFVSTASIEQQQEYYSATYDVQPLSTLDIGWVLFGDDYKRGAFLVNMKREHQNASNDCGSELPDHLPCILTLLPLMKDKQLAEELICSILIPAVEELIVRFRNKENHYRELLEILLMVLKKDFPSDEYEKFHFSHKEDADKSSIR